MPTVSFLMSNYKTPPAFLRRALDSMLAQTFTDFEAVIVNDGVKDESYDVLTEYAAKDSRIRLIENERNLGLPASLNKGLGFCEGEYVARMDTDDICYPDRLQKQVSYMEEHPDVMFAGAWADVFTDDDEQTQYSWQPVMRSPEEYRIRLLFANNPCLIHPTVIFRAAFLRKHGLRYSEDPLYRYSEDYEMWTRCADQGAAGILEESVIKYRNAQTENRITVLHAEEMEACARRAQQNLFSRLRITLTEETYRLNLHLLDGRKPYDIRYKRWMDTILQQNRKYRIYDRTLLKSLFHERWYNIVYYGIKKKKSLTYRLRCFLTLYPDGYLRMIIAVLSGKKRKKP